jgi:hypothetical protein
LRHKRRRLLPICSTTIALLVVAVGCGGGGVDQGEASNSGRAAFIKRADSICTKTDAKQKAAQAAFLRKYPEASGTQLWEEKLVLVAALPPVKVEAEELAELSVPSGDEQKIEAIIAGLEEGVEKGEAEPGVMITKGPGPFAKLEKLAREYGFKACALPL